MPKLHKRVPSYADIIINTVKAPNTSYVSNGRFWVFYIFLIIFTYLSLKYVVLYSSELSTVLTVLNFLHTVITLVLLHGIKGADLMDAAHPQGEYSKMTFYEQIQIGQQFTPTKKFLLLVPLIMFGISVFAGSHLFLNFVLVMFCVVPKLPIMDKVRLFGIEA